jgi:two-component system phosphate regulon sensor histidine kinase PhoR
LLLILAAKFYCKAANGGVVVPKEKILVADDEPDVLALCMRIIRSEGYAATGVSNGRQAIEAAEREQFDLFLTDLMMPGVRGLDAAQEIRAFQPGVVCVMMTGFGTMDVAVQALQLGFSEFVVKPFKPRDLKMAIARALEKERLRRENERLRALVPLFELNKTMMATVEEDELAARVLSTACDELVADLGVLLLRDRNAELQVRASLGCQACAAGEDTQDLLASVARILLEARRQTVVCRAEPGEGAVVEAMRRLQVDSLLFNPLLAMDTPLGALILARTEDEGSIGAVDRELISVLCGQAAVAFQNARLFEEIQRAYAELQQLDHMKSEFINIAAHELRTPLAILMGHADLLAEDIQEPGTKRRLQIIVRNALRLSELIRDLLDMRHLQTGEARVRVSTFDVEDLVANALQDFLPMAEKKEIEVSSHVPPGLAPIQNDRQRILITLNNLVQNAISFTHSGGRVGVEVSDRENECWVTVWDTGVGIAREQLERIFSPFYQVESSLTREHEGMGLGLAIAKGMIELCGGRIWVESTLGQGSRFTFSIPKELAPARLPLQAEMQ